MQVTFLFWNVYGRSLETRIGRIAAANSVDVLMLAECPTPSATLLAALNIAGVGVYCYPFSPDGANQKVKILTRFSESMIAPQFDDDMGRFTIRTLKLAPASDILLGVVHLVSKNDYTDEEQAGFAAGFASDLNRVEDDLGNRRSILVGDFNMNPFEKGIIGAQGFHAVMTKRQARRIQRIVQGKKYRYFYNPMWGQFGDRTAGPAGTYHRSSSNPHQYFWNIYDQVLLRPALMDSLRDLEILTSDGNDSLLSSNGLPLKNGGSDHLPLLFRMDL